MLLKKLLVPSKKNVIYLALTFIVLLCGCQEREKTIYKVPLSEHAMELERQERLIGIYQETAPITYSSGSVVSKFSMQERRLITTVTPYEKTTREQMLKQMKNVFGNRLYLTNPMFYMTGPKEILHLGQKRADYQFVGGLYIPEKAHVYMPLEKE